MKKIILELDDCYKSVMSITPLYQDDEGVLNLLPRGIDLRKGNHVIFNADGTMIQDSIEEL